MDHAATVLAQAGAVAVPTWAWQIGIGLLVAVTGALVRDRIAKLDDEIKSLRERSRKHAEFIQNHSARLDFLEKRRKE